MKRRLFLGLVFVGVAAAAITASTQSSGDIQTAMNAACAKYNNLSVRRWNGQ